MIDAKEQEMTIDKLLDETIKLLENQIPANPASERNERLEKRMQKSIAEYFHDVDQGIDWNALEQIYYKGVSG